MTICEWNDIISKLCLRNAYDTNEQRNIACNYLKRTWKKVKKVLDRLDNVWYDIKVACDGVEKEWKNFLEKS